MPRSGNKGNFDEVLASLIQAHTGALQPLIYGKECYIVIVIYLSYKHKQFQIINTIDERRPKIVRHIVFDCH